jgi:photosystem II stability/assembly factor-like uncharacterized protein
MVIALSHGGTTIYSSPEPSAEVLVGTLHGVATLVRDDDGWRLARRALEDKHISAIIVEPESGLVVAGAFSGGVHASMDGGRTWERRDRCIGEDDVYSLASVRLHGRPRLYAGTEPARLYFSDDLGRSWTELPGLRAVSSVPRWTFPAPPHVAHVKHITFSPDDPATIFVSIEQGGLLMSADAGETWTELHLAGLHDDLHRLVIHPRDARLLYANTGAGLYISADGGATWEQRTSPTAALGGYPDGLVLRPSRPDEMFISAAHHNPGDWRTSHFAGARISRSRDGGRTWDVLGGGLPDRLQASIEAMCLEEWEGGYTVYAATTAGEVWASADAGDSWACIARDLTPISKGGHYRPLVPA